MPPEMSAPAPLRIRARLQWLRKNSIAALDEALRRDRFRDTYRDTYMGLKAHASTAGPGFPSFSAATSAVPPASNNNLGFSPRGEIDPETAAQRRKNAAHGASHRSHANNGQAPEAMTIYDIVVGRPAETAAFSSPTKQDTPYIQVRTFTYANVFHVEH